MKHCLLIAPLLLLIISLPVGAQTIGFIPEKLPSVEQEDYGFAVRVLEETYETVRQNAGELNYINYWNLALDYTMILQPQNDVAHFIAESVRLNPLGFQQLASDPAAAATVDGWRMYLERV